MCLEEQHDDHGNLQAMVAFWPAEFACSKPSWYSRAPWWSGSAPDLASYEATPSSTERSKACDYPHSDRATRVRKPASGGKELAVGPLKSAATNAILTLPPFAVQALRHHRRQQHRLRLALGQAATLGRRWVEPG